VTYCREVLRDDSVTKQGTVWLLRFVGVATVTLGVTAPTGYVVAPVGGGGFPGSFVALTLPEDTGGHE
jgi:hypothetical protein